MPTQEETHEATPEQTQEQIIALAERLARRERFDPAWITYPRWTGHSLDLAPILEKADKFKNWAKAMLAGEITPPPWLAKEDPAFRDPELNKPSTNPNNLSKARLREIERTRFACRIELETVLPSPAALPKPKRPPGKEQILDLAMRLDGGRTFRKHFPKFFYYYPAWASYPPHYAPALAEVARLKQQAEAILKGEQRPPPWLVDREPERWIYRQEVKTAPAPAKLYEADAYLQRQAYPLIAAWILRATSPSPPALARPPTLQAVWLHPHRIDGDARPVLPPVRQRETRSVSREMLFGNQIAVMCAA